ncbi:DNA topology modulation protein [Planomicrobium sp. Y74]|uniref:DNA topology modulation protein n=1 Tax=Planomicrobium sp. Y74 TaxID=2478977 RepID=UPI000EF46653|nr:DNA topology modulation protein [Planomicrobium sp. Y74]RLQ92821.1 DNA topology modulation protein [Planomicrobium sp. Y74]
MRRIALIGSGGSGKSTLARELGSKLNIEVYHLDALFWKPNWQPTSKEEQRKVQHQLVKKEEWIIDGNYNGTTDIRLSAAGTVIFLDFHRALCTYRALKRMVQYRNRKRPDMAEGVEERFDLNFIKWIWNYPKSIKPIVLQRLEDLPKDKTIVILKSPKEAQRFLENIFVPNEEV